MENKHKKIKLEDDDGKDKIETLIDVCNWSYPDNIAIEYHDTDDTKTITITYAELDIAKRIVSDVLAHIKCFEFIGISNEIVEFCVPSLMLGILASGHAFVNVSELSVIHKEPFIYLKIHYLFVKDLTINVEVINQFEIHGEKVYLVKISHIEQKVQHQDSAENRYAYAVTTSGSTGLPKMIKVPHSCILPNIQDLQNIFAVTEREKIAQLTHFTFDPCVIEIFLSLSCGSTLFMVSKMLKNDPHRLVETLFYGHVTIVQITPSVFLHVWSPTLLKLTLLHEVSCLRILIFGGEPFPKMELLTESKHPANETRIFNIYGITEVSCWSSINEITSTSTSISHLGTPLSKTEFQVRDTNGKVVNEGEGVLYIGGRYCAIDNESITALEKPVFRNSGDIVAIDSQKRILYRGRQNNIIKRFGNKIDLHRIDAIILNLNFVNSCYSFWNEETHMLHLFLSTKRTLKDLPSMRNDIITQLRQLKVLYKPDKIHFLDHFEFTSNGKISTQFLKNICNNSKTSSKDSVNILDHNSIEEVFRDIWTQYFKTTDDTFLKLGGTSVTAIQISNITSEILKTEFPELIGILLRDATFEECVTYIKKKMVMSKNENTTTAINRPQPSERVIFTMSEFAVQENIVPIDNQTTYKWQKCESKPTGSVRQTHECTSQATSGIKIQNSYDLKKCVDASPTVFHYSNKSSFATVGSHSGIICTVELAENNAKPYMITLPHRIEASVLILDDFRGIVGCYDSYVYCIHLQTGDIFWKYQTEDIVKCTAITCEQRKNVFFGCYDYCVYSLSAKDGSINWKTKVGHGSISATGCLHLKSKSVLFGALDGTCVALHQSSGKIMWKDKLEDPIFVGPTVLNNGLVLFCSVTGELTCFDIEANSKLWTYTVDGNVFSCPVIQHDLILNCETIILASRNKHVYCLQVNNNTHAKASPTLKNVIKLESTSASTPWCEGDLLVIASTDGKLSIYRLSTGEILTSIKLPGDIFSSPVMIDNFVVVGCRDNHMYVLKLDMSV